MKKVAAALFGGLATLAVTLAAPVSAQENQSTERVQMTVGKLLAEGAVQLSNDELKKLLPGAHVTHYIVSGSKRTWVNACASEEKCAGGDMKNLLSVHGNVGVSSSGGGQGTWSIEDCGWKMSIQWNLSRKGANTENPCRRVFKLGDAYYAAADSSLKKPETPVGRYEFSR